MFENILFGPMCIVFSVEDRIRHLREIAKNGYHPIAEIKKGELVLEMRRTFEPQGVKVKSIILCIGYKKILKE